MPWEGEEGGEGGERGERGVERKGRGKVQCPVSTVVQVSGYTVTECHICQCTYESRPPHTECEHYVNTTENTTETTCLGRGGSLEKEV